MKTSKNTPVAAPEISAAKQSINWNPWIAVILVIVCFLAAQIIGQLLASIYPTLKHMTTGEAQAWLEDTIWVQFVYTLIAYGLLLLLLALFVRHRKVAFATFGLKKPRFKDFGAGLLAVVPYYVTYIIIIAVVTQLIPSLDVNQEQQIGFQDAYGFWALLFTFLSLAVIPPIAEEITVRGFLYTSLRAKLALPVAVILTSIVFAIGHLQFGSGAPLLWVAAIDTFTLSLFLIYLRQKTGSLWASITLHAAKNSIAFYYLFILHSR